MSRALEISLGEQQIAILRERAEELGLSVEELARAAILELVQARDKAFEDAAARVLRKNAELYRRLA